MISFPRHYMAIAVIAAALLISAPSQAITVQIDYRYDVHGFFNAATSAGAKARAAVDAAAAFFSNIINDSLSAIGPPSGSNVWRQVIMHPGTGQMNYSISSAASRAGEPTTLPGWTAPADEYRNISVASSQVLIYAGATNLDSLGVGGTAFASYGTDAFNNALAHRNKPASEYAAWGGYVSFDNTGVNWHLDYAQPVPAGKSDLYSTALHEIGHVLGLSTSNDQWNRYQGGNVFQGPESTAAWKADDPAAPAGAAGVPTVSAMDRHWKDNVSGVASVRSKILGTNTLQEAAMDPTLTVGTRKLFTNVDAKALRDVGWTVPSSVFDVAAPPQPGDFNADHLVNGADLLQWRAAYAKGGDADADQDGDSDGYDLLLWQRSATAPATAVTAAVPEPAAVASACCWLLLVLLPGRRRMAIR